MTFFAAKVSIVTGGASGIGRALVDALAAAGGSVVIVDIDEAQASAAARELQAAGREATTSVADVRNLSALRDIVDETVARHGHVDFMFNNAGIGVLGEACDHSEQDWKDVVETDLMGTVNGIQAVYPIMLRQRSGHIVNTASLSGLIPMPWNAAYVAAKSGIVSLSHALRNEAAPHGVRVSVVCPAAVETPMFDTNRIVGITKEQFKSITPGKPISADACAAAILRGVEHNRATITPGTAAWLLWTMHRFAPFLTHRLARTLVLKLRRLKDDHAKATKQTAAEQQSTRARGSGLGASTPSNDR